MADELVGGPRDGSRISDGDMPFVWIGGDEKPRRFRIPGKGRHLYRLFGRAYIYAGHTHAYCDPKKGGCGGFVDVGEGERNLTCEICGTALVRGHALTLSGR